MMKIQFVIVFLSAILFYVNGDCELRKSSQKEKDLLKRLEPLFKQSYTFTDNIKQHSYYFTVCDIPDKITNKTDSIGLVQERIDNKQIYVVGRLNDVDLEGTDDTIRMVYNDGDPYGVACGKENRTAVIYFSCRYDQDDSFSLVEENSNREDDCAYIFELKTSKMCKPRASTTTSTTTSTQATVAAESKTSDNKNPSGLGIFGIICVIILSIGLIYLLGGVMYLRFIKSQRGWQQIPHFRFWNRVGNFQADLCDLVCRCNGANESTAQPYESLTGQLSDDENMLNV